MKSNLSATLSSAILCCILFLAMHIYQIVVQVAPSGESSVSSLLTETATPAGFSYATEPRQFIFPKDHAAHYAFRSEWWYFTGNLIGNNKQSYGFDLTVFRFGLKPQPSDLQQSLRSSHIYLAHFAIADVTAKKYLKAEKFARELPGLTGVTTEPINIQVENWWIKQDADKEHVWQLRAATPVSELDLTLSALRPIALQGTDGLSSKSATPGNASYYYSIPRLRATGRLRLNEQEVDVTGEAWFDREWSTSALERGQVGWDWFGLHLNEDIELMYYQIRKANGDADGESHGTLFLNHGEVTRALDHSVKLYPLKYWRSPTTNTRYPVEWRMVSSEYALDITITAKFDDQQWTDTFDYWEGAVTVTGNLGARTIKGSGFLEMTGYDQ